MFNSLKYVLLFLSFQAFISWSQTIPYIQYTESDGLPHSIVYRIFQDNNSFIWLSTDNGLSRFDGNDFLNYHTDDGLGSDFVFDLYQKDPQHIQIAAFRYGIVDYNTSKRSFKQGHSAKEIGFPIDFLKSDKGIYVFNNTNQVLFKEKNGTKFKFLYDKVSSGLQLKNGQVLFSGTNGVRNDKGSYFFFNKTIYVNQTLELSSKELLFVCRDQLIIFDRISRKVKRVEKAQIEGKKPAFIDYLGNVWIASLNGDVWRYSNDLKSKELIFRNVLVNQFFEDHNKVLWLATYGQGLWCVPNVSVKEISLRAELYHGFKVQTQNGKDKIITFKQLFRSEKVDFQKEKDFQFENIDFLNDDHGVCYFDDSIRINITSKYLNFQSKKANFYIEIDQKEFVVTQIEKIAIDKFIIATRKGLYELDCRKKRLLKIAFLKDEVIYDIDLNKDQTAVATSTGVYYFQKGWKRIKTLNGQINTVCFNKKGSKLFIGTKRGVYVVALNSTKPANPIRFNRVNCNDIVCDNSNGLWFALTDGLLYYNGKFKFFGITSGVKGGSRKIYFQQSKQKLYLLYYNTIAILDKKDLIRKDRYSHNELYIDYLKTSKDVFYPNKDEITFNASEKEITIKVVTPFLEQTTDKKLFYSMNDGAMVRLSRNGQLTLGNIDFGKNKIDFLLIGQKGILKKASIVFYNPYPFYLHPIVLTLFFLLGILSLVFIVRKIIQKAINIKKKQQEAKEQLLELRQKSLLNMLNPHFLNNAINSIQAFVVKNDQRNTLRYLSRLAKLMRVNLELLEKSFVSLRKEIASIELYVQFEQIRSENKFEFEILLQENLNIDEVLIPSFVIQPFIENAIWHGVLPSDKKCFIKMEITKINDNQLKIVIEDDGIGLLKSQANKKENPTKISRGTNIIKERLAILNDSSSGYGIQLKDFSPEGKSGTQVTLIVPFQKIHDCHS